MYNLYINTTGSQNKGTFKIDYRYKPLYFEEGSKIAFNNMLMYNSINNISSNLGNNVIYILADPYPISLAVTTESPTPQPSYGELPEEDSNSSPDSEGFYKAKHDSKKDYPVFNDVFVKKFDGD